MGETNLEGNQERKEKPGKLVVEIGANDNNSALKSYKIPLEPDVVFRLINIDYDRLPNEQDADLIVSLEDGKVEKIILSNVLSDSVYFDYNDKKRIEDFWQYMATQNPDYKNLVNRGIEEVSYFQRIRTLKEALRILKPNGQILIYENFNQLHPESFSRILEWLQKNPEIQFEEDFEEEKRIQPILDEDNKKSISEARRLEPNKPEDAIWVSRKHNKVYRVTKKPPQ